MLFGGLVGATVPSQSGLKRYLPSRMAETVDEMRLLEFRLQIGPALLTAVRRSRTEPLARQHVVDMLALGQCRSPA